MFRYAILGAADIANKFCHAVSFIEDCMVCAVASKSMERAKNFAEKNHIEHYYDNYETLLEEEKPDCVYIAVTTNDHFRLTMLCLEKSIPVLCEKAMFCNTTEATTAFELARKKNIFLMEAMWSRFLPPIKKAKQWLLEGRIGTPEFSQIAIGFIAQKDDENRFFNPALGGGVAYDLTVYTYMLTTFILGQQELSRSVHATWSKSGVDVTNHISIRFEHTPASLLTTFVSRPEEKLVIYGSNGKIVVPKSHFASECYLYDTNDELLEHFVDTETPNGFIYEAKEAMRCVQEGLLESPVVPWKDTMDAVKLYDEIWATAPDRN